MVSSNSQLHSIGNKQASALKPATATGTATSTNKTETSTTATITATSTTNAGCVKQNSRSHSTPLGNDRFTRIPAFFLVKSQSLSFLLHIKATLRAHARFPAPCCCPAVSLPASLPIVTPNSHRLLLYMQLVISSQKCGAGGILEGTCDCFSKALDECGVRSVTRIPTVFLVNAPSPLFYKSKAILVPVPRLLAPCCFPIVSLPAFFTFVFFPFEIGFFAFKLRQMK